MLFAGGPIARATGMSALGSRSAGAAAKAVSGIRKAALAHFTYVGPGSLDDFIAELCETFHELRSKPAHHSQKVIADQNLTVAVRSRADANGWNGQLFRDAAP